jgi:hypothetical protein
MNDTLRQGWAPIFVRGPHFTFFVSWGPDFIFGKNAELNLHIYNTIVVRKNTSFAITIQNPILYIKLAMIYLCFNNNKLKNFLLINTALKINTEIF